MEYFLAIIIRGTDTLIHKFAYSNNDSDVDEMEKWLLDNLKPDDVIIGVLRTDDEVQVSMEITGEDL
ncbi:MAG TPA: hypothetical protein PKD55_01310 [Bellilinea sp.]|nr:hypothetical protein [Bellilinea sp.]